MCIFHNVPQSKLFGEALFLCQLKRREIKVLEGWESV
jgi:hypothetical protein